MYTYEMLAEESEQAAARYGVPGLVFVLNGGALGAGYHKLNASGQDTRESIRPSRHPRGRRGTPAPAPPGSSTGAGAHSGRLVRPGAGAAPGRLSRLPVGDGTGRSIDRTGPRPETPAASLAGWAGPPYRYRRG